MDKNIANAQIIYVNKLTNTCYTDGEILELTHFSKKEETIKDSVFNLFAKLITRCEEQRQVYHYLVYKENTISVSRLVKILAQTYNKSERTYRRSIENLNKGKIIIIDKGIIRLNIDYDLSLLDLDETKGLIIHIS